MKSQAIKTAMGQNPVRSRVTTAKVEERQAKVETKPKEEAKLPPGAKAVNTFWTKVIKRDAGEDSEETVLLPQRKQFTIINSDKKQFKGILHQKIFYCLNLIFCIIMGCGIARFGRRCLKTTET